MYKTEIKGVTLEIDTADGIFSPLAPDKGTLAMLDAVEFSPNDKILDLGCGAGLVGILAAKLIGIENVVMSDIFPEAVRISRENAARNNVPDIKIAESEGFNGLSDKDFTLILSNPPYHEDFSVPKHFIEKGFNRLVVGGRLVMVTKRRDWYKKKLTAIFGGVRIIEKDGYFVFTAEKRSVNYAKKR